MEEFFKTSTDIGHRTYVKDAIQPLLEGLLNSTDYKKLEFSYQLNFLKAISHSIFDIEHQVKAFESLQNLQETGAQQDRQKGVRWRDNMVQTVLKKNNALLLVGEAYPFLSPAERAAGANITDVLKALREQEKLKGLSGIELLAAFLTIRDEAWEKNE